MDVFHKSVVVCYLWYCESRWPLGPENVQTDRSVAVYVGVVDAGRECKFGRFEWVVCRKVDVEKEHASCNRDRTLLVQSIHCGRSLPSNGESGGPRMVACQWKGSSPTGPALHWAGGSFAMSFSSLLILFKAISETKNSFYYDDHSSEIGRYGLKFKISLNLDHWCTELL